MQQASIQQIHYTCYVKNQAPQTNVHPTAPAQRTKEKKTVFSKSVFKIRISDVNMVQNTKNKNRYFQFVVRIPSWVERLAAPNRSNQRIIRTTIWKYDLDIVFCIVFTSIRIQELSNLD